MQVILKSLNSHYVFPLLFAEIAKQRNAFERLLWPSAVFGQDSIKNLYWERQLTKHIFDRTCVRHYGAKWIVPVRRVQVPRAMSTEMCTVLLNILGCSVLNSLHVTLLAHRVSMWLLGYWNIWTPIAYVPIKY